MEKDKTLQSENPEILKAEETINRINNDAAARAISAMGITAADVESGIRTILDESEKSLTVGEIPQKVREVCGLNPAPGQCKHCSTVILRDLDNQILQEMNRIITADALVSYQELNNVNNRAAVYPLLQPEAKESLKRVLNLRNGTTLRVNSAYRSIAAQYMLEKLIGMGLCYSNVPVAPVGESNHQRGLALDVDAPYSWADAFQAENWIWGEYFEYSDPPHFAYRIGRDTPDTGNLAIRAFQQLWNKHNISDPIAQDSIWGPTTESRLDRSPIGGFSTPELLYLIEPPYMEGSDVGRVQETLNQQPSISIKVDGIYGSSTEEAVKQFQQQKDLTVDGIVGPETRGALEL